MDRLGATLKKHGQIDLVLLLIAITAMSSARYWERAVALGSPPPRARCLGSASPGPATSGTLVLRPRDLSL